MTIGYHLSELFGLIFTVNGQYPNDIHLTTISDINCLTEWRVAVKLKNLFILLSYKVV